MMELQTISNIQPASFEAPKKEPTFSVTLILRLLNESIENKSPITLYQIRMLHAEFAITTRRNGVGYGWLPKEEGSTEKVYRRSKTVEEFFLTHSYPQLSVMWFRSNLGAAILQGKILAIPIIEI